MDKITIYTDGSSRGNPGPGGYGAVLLFGKHRKEIFQGYKNTTNNRMELLAAIESLSCLKKKCEVELFSDSQYVVKAVKQGWLKNWKKNNWRNSTKKAVKNSDLWKRLDKLLNQHKVNFSWVEGHAGVKENEVCDELATNSAQSSNLLVDSGYTG